MPLNPYEKNLSLLTEVRLFRHPILASAHLTQPDFIEPPWDWGGVEPDWKIITGDQLTEDCTKLLLQT